MGISSNRHYYSLQQTTGLVACIAASMQIFSGDVSADTWIETDSLQQQRYYHVATVLADGRVLVSGGCGDEFNCSLFPTSTEIFDPATENWSWTGNLNSARLDHTATLLVDGQVLAAGGRTNGTQGLNSTERFDPATEFWSPAGNMVAPRTFHTATRLLDGRVLVVGGLSSPIIHNTTEIFSPATGTWSATAALNHGRYGHTATRLSDGRVLIAGGVTANANAEIYDPATNTWQEVGALNVGRQFHESALLPDGQVLVAGGTDGGSTIFSSAEIYEPGTGTWTLTGDMKEFGRGPAVSLPDGRVLLAGSGHNPFDDFFAFRADSAQIFDPITESWSTIAPVNIPRYSHTATVLPSGKVLIAGGSEAAFSFSLFPTDSSEIYDPDAPSREPILSLLANGEPGVLFVNSGDPVEVTLELDPRDYVGQSADWWVGAITPTGVVWFFADDPPDGPGQFKLIRHGPVTLIDSTLVPGLYTFFFILDDQPDGELQATWLEAAFVVVMP